MSIEKNIGKQLDFQKELDEAKGYKEIERGEVDNPWDDLGPNYEEQKRKQKEKEEEKQRKKIYKKNDEIKLRNFDNRY
jgi:hypothetical protein